MLERHAMKDGCGNQRGGVLAEFAICLPITLLMLLGAIDFGRVWTLATASANAAHAGAQYGSQNAQVAADITGIRAAVVSDLMSSAVLAASDPGEGGLTIDDFVITPERYCECSDGGTIACSNKCGGGKSPLVFVRVRIDATFETLIDYPGIPSPVQISRAAVLRAR